jgi:hypothetical protein
LTLVVRVNTQMQGSESAYFKNGAFHQGSSGSEKEQMTALWFCSGSYAHRDAAGALERTLKREHGDTQ